MQVSGLSDKYEVALPTYKIKTRVPVNTPHITITGTFQLSGGRIKLNIFFIKVLKNNNF